MTISNENVKTTVAGDGVTTTWSYAFLIPEMAGYSLTQEDADGVITAVPPSAFSISGLGNPAGGTFTYNPGTPVASGNTLTLLRDVPDQQLTSLGNQNANQWASVESGLDWVVMQVQQLREQANRSLRGPANDAVGLVSLPSARLRANLSLSFDGTGQPTVGPPGNPQASLPTGIINVLDYNADNTGVAECSAAFILAWQAGYSIFVPAGTYRVNPFVLASLPNRTMWGPGNQAARLLANAPGKLITINGCNNFTIRGLGLDGNAAFPSSYGIYIENNSNNGEVDGCWINQFTAAGIASIGDVSNQMSGLRVANNLLLSNGKNLQLRYTNDWWMDANQFGIVGGGIIPDYGTYMDNCGAGTYVNNYHWENVTDLFMDTCGYLRIECNRIEQSRQTTLRMQSCNQIVFTGNQSFGNSTSSSGTYNCMEVSGCTNSTITNNQIFDWTGGSAQVAVGIAITGSGNILLGNNNISGYTVAPVTVDNFTIGNSLGVDFILAGNSAATVAAGTTRYIGASGAFAAEPAAMWQNVPDCWIAYLYAAVDVVAGVGQTFTYTVRKNGADTTMVATIGGGTAFDGMTGANGVSLEFSNNVALKLATSGGAAAATHRYVLGLVKR